MILDNNNINGHRITTFLILCLFGIIAVHSSYIKENNRNRKPSGERIYLEHADELTFDSRGDHPDAQVLHGNVKFRHKGAVMTCDSAFFYQSDNSFDAYSNVVITQGDSVRLVSDFANYNGNTEIAEAKDNVILKHNKSTLYTDYLDYDKLYNLAFFYDGGRLLDKDNELTSDWGEYNLTTHEAIFNYDVELDNPEFKLLTDTLHYNTESKKAHIVGPSTIYSGTRIINTKAGYYDTENKYVELSKKFLYTDSVSKDSLSEEKPVTNYDRLGDDRNVIFTDTVNKNILKCDYLYYKETEGISVAADDPVTMEYSQGDTLYMHSDTIKMFTYNIDTDSVYRKILCYNKVKAFRNDVQAVSDSMMYNSKDSCLTMYKSPIVWNENKQLTGDNILIFLKDSTINRIEVLQNAIAAEATEDSTKFNQISSRDLFAYFIKGEMVRTDAVDNVISVFFPKDDKDSSAIMMNYIETDTMKMFLVDRQLDKIWTPSAQATSYPLMQIPRGKDILKGFVWYSYLRPTDKRDIFNWREKKSSKKK